ncbi:MAG: S1-C subfamily serine protease [Pirellulaceae bacterium]|jgi:S1-C subfamily serine protease
MYRNRLVANIASLLVCYVLPICMMSGLVGNVAAEAPTGFEKASARLQLSIVTVRVSNPNNAFGNEAAEKTDAKSSTAGPTVTICSGICIGNGLIVSPAYAASDSKIRITMSNGEQSTAKLRVIDEYSGLSLLQADDTKVPSLALAEELPEVGSWVLSAAAWGTEQPVIGLGIVSGHNRSIAGLAYPPLLQCSMPSTETSSGAAVTNSDGQLIGVVVAADRNTQKGWAYAVPVRDVKRLIRIGENSKKDEGVTVLKRRRPVVGMILEGNNDKIVVTRVTKASPAEKAGIKVGDQVVEANGVKIRSVYQAVRPVLNKQPGDTIEYVVLQDEKRKSIEVVLGGGVVLPSAPFAQLGQYVRPKLDIAGNGQRMVARNARGTEREVFATGNEPAPKVDERIRLLEKALDGYRSVIIYQQNKLLKEQEEREKRVDEMQKQIEQLRQELSELKQ